MSNKSNITVDIITSPETGRTIPVSRMNYTAQYEAGLVVNSLDTIIIDGDDRYVIKGNVTLPYTCTGTGMPEGNRFIFLTDSNLDNKLQDAFDLKADITYVDSQDTILNNRITSEVSTINGRINTEVNTLNTTVGSNFDTLDDKIDSSVSTLNTAINTKVTTYPNIAQFTTPEKQKLASLEPSSYRGTYTNSSQLDGIANKRPGDYADVDGGTGGETARWIYDSNADTWLIQASATSLTAAQIKTLYEDNVDTNAYSDADLGKVAALKGAAYLNVGTAANTVAAGNDARLLAVASKAASSTVTALAATVSSNATTAANAITAEAAARGTAIEAAETALGVLIAAEATARGNALTAMSTTHTTDMGTVNTELGKRVLKASRVLGGTGVTVKGTGTNTGTTTTNLSTDLTIAIKYGTSAGTACQGNDIRLGKAEAAHSWGNHNGLYHTKSVSDGRFARLAGSVNQNFSADTLSAKTVELSTNAKIVYNTARKSIDFII